MPNTHDTLTGLFSDIADAIREKTGDSGTIVADAFPDAIAAIPSGGGGGKRCPRAETEVTWSWADIITEEMTWTATAAEYTE